MPKRKRVPYYLQNPSPKTPEEIEAWVESLPGAHELNLGAITAIASGPPTDVAAHLHDYVAEAYLDYKRRPVQSPPPERNE